MAVTFGGDAVHAAGSSSRRRTPQGEATATGTSGCWPVAGAEPQLRRGGRSNVVEPEEGGAQHNAAPEFVANPGGPDQGRDLELTAWPDGRFEVFNSRTEKTKHYSAR